MPCAPCPVPRALGRAAPALRPNSRPPRVKLAPLPGKRVSCPSTPPRVAPLPSPGGTGSWCARTAPHLGAAAWWGNGLRDESEQGLAGPYSSSFEPKAAVARYFQTPSLPSRSSPPYGHPGLHCGARCLGGDPALPRGSRWLLSALRGIFMRPLCALGVCYPPVLALASQGCLDPGTRDPSAAAPRASVPARRPRIPPPPHPQGKATWIRLQPPPGAGPQARAAQIPRD